jgi:hypothetical protein
VNCSAETNNQVGIGTAMQNPLTNNPAILVSVSLALGSGGANKLVIATFPVGTNPTLNQNQGCSNNGGGSVCSHVANGQTFTIVDVESVSGLTSSGAAGGSFQTLTLANPVTISANQWVAATFMDTVNVATWIDQCDLGCSTPSQTGYAAVAMDYATATPIVTGTGTSSAGGFTWIVGGTFQPLSSVISGGTLTQCYGNCGSPAITLLNTNSTKSVNFNQSITLFYQFQSNLNGVILNVTTNLGIVTNSNQQFQLAVYTATCGAAQSPFTNACPGQLAQGQTFIGTISKGSQSMRATNIGVLNGEWVGISVTAIFAGLILNDTNTAVPILFTTGLTPSIISSSAVFNIASKIGLWAFINGQAIIGTPPSLPGPCGQSFSGIDCIFPALVNQFCTTFTASCQTSSALFWVIMLTVGTLFILQLTLARAIPGSKIIAGGEIFVLLFVGYILMFSGLGLLPIWVPILIFFIVSLFMGKAVGRYV